MRRDFKRLDNGNFLSPSQQARDPPLGQAPTRVTSPVAPLAPSASASDAPPLLTGKDVYLPEHYRAVPAHLINQYPIGQRLELVT